MPQYLHERHFSVEEANSLLPRISVLILKLQEAMKLLEGQREQAIEALKLARGNGNKAHNPDIDGIELVRDIVGEIEGFGCVLKGFDDPLIDFPSIRGGEEVYLCWRFGEPEILAWHPTESGFAGRQPI